MCCISDSLQALRLAEISRPSDDTIGILRKDGYTVKNREFFRIGVPFTLVAVTAGYLYIWFVWRGT